MEFEWRTSSTRRSQARLSLPSSAKREYKVELWLLFRRRASSAHSRSTQARSGPQMKHAHLTLGTEAGGRSTISASRANSARTTPRGVRQPHALAFERDLGYPRTHALELTNTREGTLYHMVFATDNDAGDKIMADIYAKTAKLVPAMQQQASMVRRAKAPSISATPHSPRPATSTNHPGSRSLRALHEVAIQICS